MGGAAVVLVVSIGGDGEDGALSTGKEDPGGVTMDVGLVMASPVVEDLLGALMVVVILLVVERSRCCCRRRREK